MRAIYLKIYAVFLLALLNALTVQAGGGWPQPKGGYYLKLSEWWVVSDKHFTDTRLLDPNTTSGLFTTSLYAEYGFSKRLTGIVYAPIFSRAYVNNVVSATNGRLIAAGDAINTVGDFELTAKYTLTQNKPLAVSAALTLGLPTGESAGGYAKNLQTGDGEFNQMLRVDASGSFQFGRLPLYAGAYAAVNNRTRGFSDEYRFGLELGMALFNRKLWLISRLNGIESFQNGETAADNLNVSLFANNTELLSVGLEAAYYLTPKVGITAGFTHIATGALIYDAPSYSVGVFLDIK